MEKANRLAAHKANTMQPDNPRPEKTLALGWTVFSKTSLSTLAYPQNLKIRVRTRLWKLSLFIWVSPLGKQSVQNESKWNVLGVLTCRKFSHWILTRIFMDGDDEREVMHDDVDGLTAIGLVWAVGTVGVLVAHPQLGDAVHCGLALKLGRRASVLGWRHKDIMWSKLWEDKTKHRIISNVFFVFESSYVLSLYSTQHFLEDTRRE